MKQIFAGNRALMRERRNNNNWHRQQKISDLSERKTISSDHRLAAKYFEVDAAKHRLSSAFLLMYQSPILVDAPVALGGNPFFT